MSHTAGHHMSTYPTGHNQLFISGMRVAFVVAIILCVIAFILTAYRMWQNRKQTA